MRRVARTLVGVALGLATLASARGAAALDPPPAASFAALVADVASALREAKRIASVVGVAEPVARAEAACAALLAAPGACALPESDACQPALVATFASLREARASLELRRAAAADAVAGDLFDVASRLALARGALARHACDTIAAPGTHPTQMLLGPDGRSLLVRPLTALRGGRRYAVVAQGVDAATLEALRGSLVPRPEGDGIAVPPGAFVAPVAQELPGDAGGISTSGLESLIARLERDASAMPGLGTFSGVRVTLPSAVRAEQVGTLQLAFAPVDAARASETLAVLRTLDARAGLLEDRARVATLACVARPAEVRDAKQTLGARLPHVAALLRGTYHSLGVSEASASSPLGVPAAEAKPLVLPYLLALPQSFSAQTPLVVVVDGHAGSAARILGKHASALTERGLAVLAIELPAHGERAVAGTDFLDALDPAALGRNVRQAAVDVLAAVHAATQCGLALPGGVTLRVPEVRYLGYSLGAMVGSIARAVEPRIGTAVLAAPGGDILGWLLLRISPKLGGTYVTCLGGPQEGESCIPTGQCAEPGACMVDPFLERLHWLLALPYELAAAGADPLSYVTHRTGAVTSHGRLLLITGGEDAALHPALATRLADAYRMRPVAPYRRRGPRAQMVQWPELGHELVDRPGVRAQITEFLATDGRDLLLAREPAATTAPGWYQVYGASRK